MEEEGGGREEGGKEGRGREGGLDGEMRMREKEEDGEKEGRRWGEGYRLGASSGSLPREENRRCLITKQTFHPPTSWNQLVPINKFRRRVRF